MSYKVIHYRVSTGKELAEAIEKDINVIGKISWVIETGYGCIVVYEDLRIPDSENATSGVIKTPTPQDIKNEEKRKIEEIISNPKKIINRIRQKASEE